MIGLITQAPRIGSTVALRAYIEIAASSGTVTLGEGNTLDNNVEPAWARAADLRWVAMTKYLKARNADGELTFGEVRAAFIDAAGDVGMDPGIVGRAFDHQGITSVDWKSPPCSTYHAAGY